MANQFVTNPSNIVRPEQYRMANTTIAFCSSREEALMMNVMRGFKAYIFNMFEPVFYLKTSDALTGEISFQDFSYEEIKKPEPVPTPAPDAVTKADLADFKNDIMNSISTLIANGQSKNTKKGANANG
jgi:hypothetical protein